VNDFILPSIAANKQTLTSPNAFGKSFHCLSLKCGFSKKLLH